MREKKLLVKAASRYWVHVYSVQYRWRIMSAVTHSWYRVSTLIHNVVYGKKVVVSSTFGNREFKGTRSWFAQSKWYQASRSPNTVMLRLHWHNFIAHFLPRRKFANVNGHFQRIFRVTNFVPKRCDMPAFPLGKRISVNAHPRKWAVRSHTRK